jgi:hypothetical protein
VRPHLLILASVGLTACGNEINAPGLNDHRVTVEDGDHDAFNGDTKPTNTDSDGPPISLVVSTLTATSPTTQSTFAGMEVDDAPAVVVHDQFGNPMASQAVRFTVDAGGGVIAPDLVTTDAQGKAVLTSWKLGKKVTPNAVHAKLEAYPAIAPVQFNATVLTNYTITIDFVSSVTAEQRAFFENAASRWSAVIVGELPDFVVTRSSLPGGCGYAPDSTPINVDDMIIFASVAPIDGPLGILAQAQPCAQHDNGAIAIGVMAFDSDDLGFLEANGKFEETVLHEMGHVIGIGSVWGLADLIVEPSIGHPGANTRFIGSNAAQAYVDLNGVGFPGAVPVENNGVSGSADAHWRESVFGIELMSPSITGTESSLPMSAITVASLHDLGVYAVNDAAADNFVFGMALTAGPPPPPIYTCTMGAATSGAPLGTGTMHVP